MFCFLFCCYCVCCRFRLTKDVYNNTFWATPFIAPAESYCAARNERRRLVTVRWRQTQDHRNGYHGGDRENEVEIISEVHAQLLSSRKPSTSRNRNDQFVLELETGVQENACNMQPKNVTNSLPLSRALWSRHHWQRRPMHVGKCTIQKCTVTVKSLVFQINVKYS